MQVRFFLNLYDDEGDVYNKGLFLNFNDQFILKLKDKQELKAMIQNLNEIQDEIEANL